MMRPPEPAEVSVLNLYLAPRAGGPLEPERLAAALTWLADEGIVGAAPEGTSPEAERVPGVDVRRLFHDDAAEWLLPAELTFDALRVVRSGAARFLPEGVDAFEEARCPRCGDDLDPEALAEDLGRLLIFPVDRFAHLCPSCHTELSLKEIDFGQPTAVAQDWILVEGAGTSRLSSRVLDQLVRLLGVPLVVVPEVLEDGELEGEGFAVPIKGQSRRSGGRAARRETGARRKRGR